MSIKSFVTRTARGLAVTAVAIGTFAGLAAVPANAATVTASAVSTARAAAVSSSVTFAVQCQPGAQYFSMTIKTSGSSLSYAYRLGAYEWTSAGWRWDGLVTGFRYGTTVGMNTMQIGGVQSLTMAPGRYWVMAAQVFVWDGSNWTPPVWVFADHSDSQGHYGQAYCRT